MTRRSPASAGPCPGQLDLDLDLAPPTRKPRVRRTAAPRTAETAELELDPPPVRVPRPTRPAAPTWPPYEATYELVPEDTAGAAAAPQTRGKKRTPAAQKHSTPRTTSNADAPHPPAPARTPAATARAARGPPRRRTRPLPQ